MTFRPTPTSPDELLALRRMQDRAPTLNARQLADLRTRTAFKNAESDVRGAETNADDCRIAVQGRTFPQEAAPPINIFTLARSAKP